MSYENLDFNWMKDFAINFIVKKTIEDIPQAIGLMTEEELKEMHNADLSQRIEKEKSQNSSRNQKEILVQVIEVSFYSAYCEEIKRHFNEQNALIAQKATLQTSQDHVSSKQIRRRTLPPTPIQAAPQPQEESPLTKIAMGMWPASKKSPLIKRKQQQEPLPKDFPSSRKIIFADEKEVSIEVPKGSGYGVVKNEKNSQKSMIKNQESPSSVAFWANQKALAEKTMGKSPK